jgi:hypothetical protein
MREIMRASGWTPTRSCIAVCAVCLALGGCRAEDPQTTAAIQTKVPGHISAGGATSGEVVAAGQQGKARGDGQSEGTPGIPEGSGGNTGGVAMGGTSKERGTDQQAAKDDAAGKRAPDDKAAAEEKAAAEAKAKASADAEADRQKQLLAVAMDRSAERWRQQAGAATKQTPPGAAGASGRGFQQSEDQSSASGQPAGQLSPQEAPRSEKHGTAAPSEDVKQPQAQTPEGSGAPVPADAYKPAP